MKYPIGSWVQPVGPVDHFTPHAGQVVAHEMYTDHMGTRETYEVRFRRPGGEVEREAHRFREQELEPFEK